MNIAQHSLVTIIRAYQRTLSPDHGWWRRPTCRFSPTCSEYSIEAIRKYGAVAGTWKGLRRVARCNPFVAGGFDPIS